MPVINVRETRQNIGQILDAVTTGEEFVITRRNKPIAKLSKINDSGVKQLHFPDRSDFRAKLPKSQTAGSKMICEMRNEQG